MQTSVIHWRYLLSELVCDDCIVDWTYTQKQPSPGRFELRFIALFRDRKRPSARALLNEELIDLIAQIEYANSQDLLISEAERIERTVRNGNDIQIAIKHSLVIPHQKRITLDGKIWWELVIGDSTRQMHVTEFLLNLETEKTCI